MTDENGSYRLFRIVPWVCLSDYIYVDLIFSPLSYAKLFRYNKGQDENTYLQGIAIAYLSPYSRLPW